MSVKHLGIAVIGDEELANAMRLTGISKYYTMQGDHDTPEKVRKTLTELLADPDVGIVIILEDYAPYVEDLMSQFRKKKGTNLVIVEVPSKFGTKHPNIKEYYRALIRESIGFEIEI
jgi:V/A-type H+-transporting ATPase subunit F